MDFSVACVKCFVGGFQKGNQKLQEASDFSQTMARMFIPIENVYNARERERKNKMGKTRGVHETTPEIRNRMVGMYEAGLGLKEIAAAVNCSQRTVKRWLNRFDKEGTVETRDRCGRKRATTQEQDEAIIRLATETPITAAKTVLPALGLKCSVDTVRERLHKAGIHNWSPCKKHILKIPINETDGVEIQQSVWRPTGTQLGKRKITNEISNIKSCNPQSKKKIIPQKKKFKQPLDKHGISNNRTEQLNGLQNCSFSTFPQNEQMQPQITEIQPIVPTPPLQSHPMISTNSSQYNHSLNLIPQFQPIYHHSGHTVSQNWPLDLVHNTQHHIQNQQNSNLPEQSTLHIQTHPQLLTNQDEGLIPHLQDEVAPIHLQENSILEQEVDQHQKLSEISPKKLSKSQNVIINVCSDVCPNSNGSCNENSQNINTVSSPIHINNGKNSSVNNKIKDRVKKKMGGKVKGTLETSVEIRNRMIGMSEAGLSTLSIALAINRSERTVKRWLDRWHKEGHVQTKERKGRRRITTKEQDDAIIAMASENPLTAAKYVAPALGLKCSVDTVRERLHKAGIHSWKLGKKQGQSNVVHRVHVWQPSGNRTNKIKANKNKNRKSSNMKCKSKPQISKEVDKKQRKEVIDFKTSIPITSMVSEENNSKFQNQSQSSLILHTVQDIPNSSIGLVQPQLGQISICPPISTPPHTLQVMGPIIHQRSDCRLAFSTVVPSISNQSSVNITYPSCITGNNHSANLEQSDPMNYEPYIWSF